MNEESGDGKDDLPGGREARLGAMYQGGVLVQQQQGVSQCNRATCSFDFVSTELFILGVVIHEEILCCPRGREVSH